MKKHSIRWLFLLVIVLFFAELLVALKMTEPFPAIIYPSFSDIPSVNSTIQKPIIYVFFNDQDSVEIAKEDFFNHSSNVYTNVFLAQNFNESNSFQASEKDVKTLSANVGTKRVSIDMKEVWDETQIKEGKMWIASSIKNSLERDDFTRLEVQWYNYTLTQDKKEPLKQGALAERFVVNFKN